jgi:hypothetical protein
MSVPFRSTWLGFSSFSLFCIQFKVYPHQLSVADWVVREVPAGSDVPQPSSIFPLVISSTFPFHTRIQLSKGVFSLSLPVKRAGNLFSYQIWWYLVVVVVVVEIACQFMISLVIHSRGFHVTLTFFPWSIASKFLCLTDGRLVHSRGNDFQVKLRDWRVIELWLSCRNARPEENGIWS